MNLKHVIVGLVAVLSLSVPGFAAASDVADAAEKGDIETVRLLLGQGNDVNETQNDGATALHWAAYHDDRDLAAVLLEAGADADAANRAGFTPMVLATINGSAPMISLFLEAGADPNHTLMHGETPLMFAARTGTVDAIQTLIDAGADVNATEDLRGTTPLMWAAAEGNAPALQALIDAGADVRARSASVAAGRGPYLAPTPRSRIEGARAGIGQAGGGVAAANPDTLATVINDEEENARQAAQAFELGRGNRELTGGHTALTLAARRGDIECARVLLDAGAFVNQVTTYGWTALLTATQNRYYELGLFLLERGADPNIANDGGWTPLYIATDNRNIEGGDYPVRRPTMDHLEFIKALLEAGADPNLRMRSSTETRTIFTHQWLYEEGATPFLRAAQSGDLVLMQLLLDYDADPSIATTNGTTPLMVASGIGWVEGVTYEWSPEQTIDVVDLLLDLGADVNAQDDDGRTALMGAAHKGSTEVAEMLIDKGARLDTHDFGSRDSINQLEGITWEALDYADGLVRVGVQSAVPHPETAALIREKMMEAGMEVPPEGRTLDSICVTAVCQ